MVGIGHCENIEGERLFVNVSDECYSVTSTYLMTTDDKEQDDIDSGRGVISSGNIFDVNTLASGYFETVMAVKYALEVSFGEQSNVSDKLRDIDMLLDIRTVLADSKDADVDMLDLYNLCQTTIVDITGSIIEDLQTLAE